jgi:dipeptidyl aminopeptidase/acylaminoacyl peptidase
MMGDDADKFIYVVPTYRGEILNFDGRTFKSDGDRTDALDGATDDAIALLNVALETTPTIDSNRICAFGRSRGGTVAMLAGIRDKRIKCVVNWSGPTDWFYLMGTSGWSEQELWSEGLRTRANTQQTGGQNVERFLKRAIDGDATVEQVRHRMIASSPLYFAHLLPRSQHHYGLEDTSVPTRNGRALVEHLRRHRIPSARYKAFFYPAQGHDTDRIMAPIHSRAFLMKILNVK